MVGCPVMSVSVTAPIIRWQTPGPTAQLPFAKILPVIRAGLAAAPEHAGLKLDLAKALFGTGRQEELVDRLRAELADEAGTPELLYYLGRAALATRDYQVAADALRAATARGMTSAFGYLAEALARLDRPDEALSAAQRGLERSPL